MLRCAVMAAILLCACAGDGSDPGPAAAPSDGGPDPAASSDGGPDAAASSDSGLDAAPSSDGGPDAAPSSDGGCTTGVCGVARVGEASARALQGCTYASPLAYESEVLVATGETLTSFSMAGEELWRLTLPAPEGEMAFVVATPVIVPGGRLVVGYHTVLRTEEPHDVNRARLRHRVAVVDLESRSLDPEFDPIDLVAEFEGNDGEPVPFEPANALGRAELAHIAAPEGLGHVYVAFGNARDVQPWHGFLFEVDLDGWRERGSASAISASFISTPESACGTPGMSGSRSRLCGAGMWAPSGPLVIERAAGNGPEIILSTGNGQLDLGRGDYSNSLLRFTPGLAFDPGCDADACADFDPDAPTVACLESCSDLFVPRESPGDPFPPPESGVCEGLTLFECWEELDYVGGSSPAYVVKEDGGGEALAYPAKDGALYLIDPSHLGRMYDRKQLAAVCGTDDDPCMQDWAGMIVTQPAVSGSLLLVPTFMPDRTHPAGVVAVEVTQDMKLEVRWEAPRFDSPEAVQRFRRHPSRIVLSHEGRFAWLVETAAKGGKGRLVGIRVEDGAMVVDEELQGPGYRFTEPLLVGKRLFVPSCEPDNGPSALEIYDIVSAL